MFINDGEMSVGSYTHFTIIDEHFAIINEHFNIISLKYTIIRSSDHHWEAAPTACIQSYNVTISYSLNKNIVARSAYCQILYDILRKYFW